VALVEIQILQPAQLQRQQQVGQLQHHVMPVLSVEIKHQENIMEFIGTVESKLI
jgi:hypothetical protein